MEHIAHMVVVDRNVLDLTSKVFHQLCKLVHQ